MDEISTVLASTAAIRIGQAYPRKQSHQVLRKLTARTTMLAIA